MHCLEFHVLNAHSYGLRFDWYAIACTDSTDMAYCISIQEYSFRSSNLAAIKSNPMSMVVRMNHATLLLSLPQLSLSFKLMLKVPEKIR